MSTLSLVFHNLAEARLQLSAVPDMVVAPDMAAVPDMAVVPDMAAVPDMAVVPDRPAVGSLLSAATPWDILLAVAPPPR